MLDWQNVRYERFDNQFFTIAPNEKISIAIDWCSAAGRVPFLSRPAQTIACRVLWKLLRNMRSQWLRLKILDVWKMPNWVTQCCPAESLKPIQLLCRRRTLNKPSQVAKFLALRYLFLRSVMNIFLWHFQLVFIAKITNNFPGKFWKHSYEILRINNCIYWGNFGKIQRLKRCSSFAMNQ